MVTVSVADLIEQENLVRQSKANRVKNHRCLRRYYGCSFKLTD